MSPSNPMGEQEKTPPRLTRRGLVVLGIAGIATGGAVAAQWYNVLAESGSADLTPPEAHIAALSGELLLIDIRRPDEWQRTGIGEGAIPLDMRREDFEDALLELSQYSRTQVVAVICARGVRSRRLTQRLTEAGFTRIVDVPEGMLGSGAGPGWLKRELPTVAYP